MQQSKKLLFAALLLIVSCAKPAAVNGTWGVDMKVESGTDVLRFALRSKDQSLTGTITKTLPEPSSVPISGSIEGNVIRLVVSLPDGRVTTFNGEFKGEEIVFTRKFAGMGGGDGIFGMYGPSGFTVKRIQ